jgi:hypothetical protein
MSLFINRLEALADAIVEYSGYRNPESALYQSRNPGGLKAWSPTLLRDLDNYRVFCSFKAGYDALIFDLQRKCSGESHTKLERTSTLKDLITTNGFQPTVVGYVVTFLRRALQDVSISELTPLQYFAEKG